MGVKKSTVCTRASSAVSLYTPASSAVSNPTSTFSLATRGRLASTRSKTFGLSLDAQPAAFTCAVSFRADIVTNYNSGMRRIAVLVVVLLLAVAFVLVSREPQTDSRLKKSFRRAEQNGWILVHLEGAPSAVGYQHGYLLASEILDTHKEIRNELAHDLQKDWQFFRDAAEQMLWPHIEQEYREELQ